ncbi:hypothetical protein AB0F42_03950 [Streptomyces buecherae]|uniref:hypothetical protein n=1 Tax=Streptomyces buecherae TaxID=2763006 RepID=UPI0033E05369
MNKSDLSVPEDGLPGLASDLSEMQTYLATQAKRMATIVDAIESGWRSPAASTYTEFQQSVARRPSTRNRRARRLSARDP